MLARWRRASGPGRSASRREASGPELEPGQPGPVAGAGPPPASGAGRSIGSPLEAGQVGVMALRLVAMLAGLVLVGVPVSAEPSWAYPVADVGLVAVLAAAPGLWTWPGTVAAVAAIIQCAASRLGAVALAGEGLLLLCYLLLLDTPARLPGAAARRWLRLLVPGVLAALAATGALLAVLTATPGASAWITLAGLVAAVAAYLVVLPPRGLSR